MEEIEPNWFAVRLQNDQLHTFIRYGIKLNYRRYDEKLRSWVVHKAFVPIIIDKITALGLNTVPCQNKTSSPYEVLHVLPSAPKEVIAAAYKALARIHHSDMGGNDSKMAEINIAYQTIQSKLPNNS